MEKPKLEDGAFGRIIAAAVIIGTSVFIGYCFGADTHALHILEYIMEHFR